MNTGLSPTPTQLPLPSEKFDLVKFRQSKDGANLAAWVKSEHTKAASARTTKVLQWRQNLFMFFGHQWAERLRTSDQFGIRDQFLTPRADANKTRRTINRTRSFVRAEHSKFLSSIPTAVAVPATAEDEDIRAAYAAEQAWLSISETRKLRQHFTKASWWVITTGNGFIKTWWDPSCIPDKTVPADKGDISFGSISPFNLFVPDLREQDIEDQPYLVTAYKKPLEWAKHYFADALKGVDISASSTSANTILEEGYLNLSAGNNVPDSVTVYEAWVKPGGTNLLPDGGVVLMVEDVLVGVYREGLPYNHGQYPYTKFEHIPTSTFYADSPLVDTNGLQKEYNDWRSRLSDYVRVASAPQLLAQKGAIVPAKMTNEAGLIIEYKLGFQQPTPLQLSPIPQYVMDQQGIIIQDWEDITGQHEVSRGQAPSGITAGTAINYLQEKDNQFLTPQYQSIEDGYEKMAGQSLGLFVQYVDLPRKVKTIGTDGAFDTVMLQGSDLTNGTDIRIQHGSSVGQSQAAKEAKIMDMWSIGLITDPNIALKLLEIGGTQKVLDTLNVAERKAQRENTKMKLLKKEEIVAALEEFRGTIAQIQAGIADGSIDQETLDPSVLEQPPIVEVDDFDVHEVHIDSHNKFRMGQEYETLSPEIKQQFDLHVKKHEKAVQQAQMQRFLQMIPSDGTDGTGSGASPQDLQVNVGGGDPIQQSGESPVPAQGGATMSGNGAVPTPDLSSQGATA